MEKLELKHVACYLPYGLKMRDSVSGVILGDRILTFENMKWLLSNGQPILRPLSDLTEERQFGKYNTHIEEIVTECEQHCDAYDEWLEIFIDDPDTSRIMQAPYEVLQGLLEYHFDVFGLIEKGLALSYNDL